MRRGRLLSYTLATLTLTAGVLACGGGGGGGDEDETIVLRGKAVYPMQLQADTGPAAERPFDVLDLERQPPGEIIAGGMTDSDGNYEVTIPGTKTVAVVVNGTIRVSGLLTATGSNEKTKDFDGVTDVACEAGVTAVLDGSLTADELNDERIALLEDGAAILITNGEVDFDDPASVSAAAAKLRELTEDGDVPLSE